MTKLNLVEKLVKFLDSATAMPDVEVDHEKIQRLMHEAWRLAEKPHPRKSQISQ